MSKCSLRESGVQNLHPKFFAEVVLVMLVEVFMFELPQDKDIYWNFAGIIYPTIGPVDAKMQLPLRVSLAK